MAYNYYHDYPPSAASYAGSTRDRYPSNVSSSGHGTAVPPSAGPSPPPRAPPVNRPHTTQPQSGYGYGPPPITQPYGAPPRGGGMYGTHYPGYAPYGGYVAPPMAYADSLPPAQLPAGGGGGGGGGAGGSGGGNPKSPLLEDKDDREPSKPSPETLNPTPPISSSPPLSNSAALAQAEAAFPGIGERLPDFKDWSAEDRDRFIRDLVDRLVPPKYPPGGYGHPPPQHYPGPPYYGPGYYPPLPPHAGYNQHIPPPHHEGYGYPPLQPPSAQPPQPPQHTERDDHFGEDEAEEKERIDREREMEREGARMDEKERIDREREREREAARNGGAPIMPGGYASSPSRETPPPAPQPQPQSNKPSPPATPQKPPPNPKSPPPAQAHNKKVDLQDTHNRDRTGSMPPPKTRPVKTPAPEDMGKNMTNNNLHRMGSRREQQQQQGKLGAGAADSTLTALLGPGNQGDMTTFGVMWGVYLLEHKGVKKGSLPGLRPKLKALFGGIAAWIIKDLEPKDSLVIPPDKLIKFYQLSQVEDEPFKWEAFIRSLPLRNLSELYQQLECHHYLIPPPPRPSSSPTTNTNANAITNTNTTTPNTPDTPTQDSTYAPFDPTIPALTPQGFAHWMLIQLTAFPTREHRRLQKIITHFPIQDPETDTRFPKALPPGTLPAQGDGLVENWWDEAVMSVRKGGYIGTGFDDPDGDGVGGDIDFGYGPDSELVRGRERRPYAKSNVASSRGSSRAASRSQSRGDPDGGRERDRSGPRGGEDDPNFVPPLFTRKKTDQKYASTNITFDDLREDPSKGVDIERKRNPYVVPPSKGAREAVYPTGGGGGTPISLRPGGGGMGMGMGIGVGERPGSHGSGSGGSGGRLGPNNGGGVDLPPAPTHTSNTPTAPLHSNTNPISPPPMGGIKITTPPEYKPYSHNPYQHYPRYPGNNSTPTTPASAHPSNSTANNTPSTLFSSPQSRMGNTFTPTSPLSGGGAYPEPHHYPSPGPTPYRGNSRRDRERERDRDNSPPISQQDAPTSSTTRTHMRRKSMGAPDAVEYFGGALPGRGDYESERERERERAEYPRTSIPQPPPGYGYHGRRERERNDTLPSWERPGADHEDDDMDEGYYRGDSRRYQHGVVHAGHGYGHVRRGREDDDTSGGMVSVGGGGEERPGVRRRKSRGAGEFSARGDW